MKNRDMSSMDDLASNFPPLGLQGLARLVEGLPADTEVNVLGLLLDGVMTVSSICHDKAQPNLCIVAYPHEPEMPVCRSLATQMRLEFMQTAVECWDSLWHAELGCQVLIRNISLATLIEDVDILDAILDTADMLRHAARSDSTAEDRTASHLNDTQTVRTTIHP